MAIDREHWRRLSALIDQAWALPEGEREPWLSALPAADAERVREALADRGDVATLPGFDRLLGQALRPSATAELAGTRLGPWRLDEKIGEGGMGQVWRARRDDGLYRGQAAIKLLRPELGATALAARFARERALLARLQHPAIARLLDAGSGPDGQAYLVLELVEGLSLHAHVRQHAPTVAQRVRLLLRVAQAVDYAHGQLVVHRDLKPDNVRVGADGAPKLLDFGIAALLDTDPEATRGELTRQTGRGLTPGYAAPEQISGEPIGTAADVFALGVMLHELCTGNLPFGRRHFTRTAIERAVLEEAPRALAQSAREVPDAQGPGRPSDPQALRGDLQAIVTQALQKDPARRHGSVRALIDDLEAWADHRPIAARREQRGYRVALWARRNRALAAGLGVVLLSLGAGLGVSLWQAARAQHAARQADEVTAYVERLLAGAGPGTSAEQLLDRGRERLQALQAVAPETRLRLQRLLATGYRGAERPERAAELLQQALPLARQRLGDDDPATHALRLELAQALADDGRCDEALALPDLARGPALPAGTLQARCLLQRGRLDEAERALRAIDPLLAAQPAADRARAEHAGQWHALRLAQARNREALEALRAAEPFWASTDPADQALILSQQRSRWVLQARLGDEPAAADLALASLVTRIERQLGADHPLAQAVRDDLVQLAIEAGQPARALQRADGEAATLPGRLRRLRAEASAGARPAAALRAEARALWAELKPAWAAQGAARAGRGLSLAHSALALDDAELAAAVLDHLQRDTALHLDPGPQQDLALAARKAALDGRLARLRGDLDASRRLLASRLESLSRGGERRHPEAWAAALDLAFTLVRAGAPEAALALEGAESRRPLNTPADHPLDAASSWLRERTQAARDDTPALAALRLRLWRAQRGEATAELPAGAPWVGAMGGVLP